MRGNSLVLDCLPYSAPSSIGYGVLASLGGTLFVGLSLQLYKTGNHKRAMRLFAYSIIYLFLLFLGLVIDHALVSYLTGEF